jgi:hypothetical protein
MKVRSLAAGYPNDRSTLNGIFDAWSKGWQKAHQIATDADLVARGVFTAAEMAAFPGRSNPRTRRKNPTYVRAPSVAALQKLPAASHRSTSPLSKANAMERKALLDAGKPRTALNRYNEMSNSNGVEYIGGSDGGLYYVNHGDTYDTTLIYDTGKGAVKVGAWGDIVERDRRFKDS